MSTTLDEPAVSVSDQVGSAQRLRSTTAAIRLSFQWLGTRKSLSAEQKAIAAESFGAEGDYLSAGKKLLNVKHPKFKAVTQIRGRATQFWKSMSLPFPEPGIRLIRQSDIDAIMMQLNTLKSELDAAVVELDHCYADLKTAARDRLGDLYNDGDYPASLVGLFDMEWDFPSVEPPPYLRQLSPEIYRQECQRVQNRFTEAVQLAEQAFSEELAKLVEHLTERLSGRDDGKPKVFRDSVVENFNEFFDRFQSLNIGSNESLDQLVEQAQSIVGGVQPQQLRDDHDLRERISSQMSEVQSSLDDFLVDRPRRNIIRRPR